MAKQTLEEFLSQQGNPPNVVGVVTRVEGDPYRVRVATTGGCCASGDRVLLTSEIREVEPRNGGLAAIYLVDPVAVSKRLASENLPPLPKEGEPETRKKYECTDHIEWECFWDNGWKKCRPVGCC